MSYTLLAFSDYALLAARVFLGAVALAYGVPKAKNLKGTAKDFAAKGLRPGMFWGALVAVIEIAGGVALIGGLFTQLTAIVIAIEVATAGLWKIKNNEPFKGGYEFDIALFVIALVIATSGGGIYAFDNLWQFFLY